MPNVRGQRAIMFCDNNGSANEPLVQSQKPHNWMDQVDWSFRAGMWGRNASLRPGSPEIL